MKPWTELLDIAMLGVKDSDTVVEPSSSPEQSLLKQIALAGAYRRAGYVATPVKTPPNIDPAPPETIPACSLKAIEWLERVLASAYTRELARDWYLYMHHLGKRVPHVALPLVLTQAVQHETLRPYIMPVLGARGQWLAHRAAVYEPLRQPELWDQAARVELKAAEFDSENPYLTDLHKQMMEGLAHE